MKEFIEIETDSILEGHVLLLKAIFKMIYDECATLCHVEFESFRIIENQNDITSLVKILHEELFYDLKKEVERKFVQESGYDVDKEKKETSPIIKGFISINEVENELIRFGLIELEAEKNIERTILDVSFITKTSPTKVKEIYKKLIEKHNEISDKNF